MKTEVLAENRSSWASYSRIDVRVSKGVWGISAFCGVYLQWNGRVGYYRGGDVPTDFATYNDNEWTKIEIEWRSSDKTARYRINDGTWTDWSICYGGTFTDFDNVGLGFSLLGGSGGAYIDNLY